MELHPQGDWEENMAEMAGIQVASKGSTPTVE